jgi:hypothetical protein
MQSNQCVLKPNIIAYHVNDSERCEKFVSDSRYLIISEDKYWLGKGMYFWDNSNNANYWMHKKESECKDNTVFKHVGCNLLIEYLLDLTDKETLNIIEEFWKEYCNKTKDTCSYKEYRIGIKLDILFNKFPLLNIYKVVKGIGFYHKQKENEFFDNPQNKEYSHLSARFKTIYLLKDAECAVNRRFMEE